MDNITMEIMKRLDSVGEITKGAIEEIIPMASRQIIVTGFLHLFFSIILLIAIISIFMIVYKTYKGTEQFAENIFFTFLGTAPLAILLVLSFESAILKLFATEWQVIELIVQKIGG